MTERIFICFEPRISEITILTTKQGTVLTLFLKTVCIEHRIRLPGRISLYALNTEIAYQEGYHCMDDTKIAYQEGWISGNKGKRQKGARDQTRIVRNYQTLKYLYYKIIMIKMITHAMS